MRSPSTAMNLDRRAGLGVLAAALLAGCAGTEDAVVELAPADAAADVATDGALDAADAADAGDAGDAVDVAPDVPERCGNGYCRRGVEDCMNCPLDCNQCPRCDLAPTCTGALAIPTASAALPTCNNTSGSDERISYACGAASGADGGTDGGLNNCADPLLRIRVKQIDIRRGWFDIPSHMYCVISAEDGVHSELLLTAPRQAAGNRNTTHINLPLGEGVLWGQGDLYRSISNITVTYACFLSSNAAAAQRVLDAIAGRAGMAAQHADGYGWVFGAVSVLGTVIGGILGTIGDTQILDVQQTIAAGALLPMTNGRTWEIRGQHGNLGLSGAWDLRLTVESWGCADVRVAAP